MTAAPRTIPSEQNPEPASVTLYEQLKAKFALWRLGWQLRRELNRTLKRKGR